MRNTKEVIEENKILIEEFKAKTYEQQKDFLCIWEKQISDNCKTTKEYVTKLENEIADLWKNPERKDKINQHKSEINRFWKEYHEAQNRYKILHAIMIVNLISKNTKSRQELIEILWAIRNLNDFSLVQIINNIK